MWYPPVSVPPPRPPPPAPLHVMSPQVLTTVGKARGLSFFKPLSIRDMMTAVVGMEKDRAIFQGPSNEAHL